MMNRWDEKFKQHEIHATLKECNDLIGKISDDISAEAQSEKRRLSKILSAYQDTLSQLDPELVPYDILDQLNDNIHNENVLGWLKAYNQDGNDQRLISTNDNITYSLTQLSQLLPIAKKSVAEKPIRGLEKSLDGFAEVIATKTKVLEEEISKNTERLEKSQSDFDEKILGYIEEAEEKHKAVLKLHGLVAGDSVAAGYKKNADEEKKAANFWHGMTIIFIVLAAGWTLLAYFTGNSTAPDRIFFIGQIIKAFSITGVLLFGAVYSSKQSNEHRENEKRTRWFALEVHAIDPFIASLNEDDRKALKNKLSEKLFGQDQVGNKAKKMTDEHIWKMFYKGIIGILKAK